METLVSEKPILFSGEMVRAVLNGRKTQTRRVMAYPDHGVADCTHSNDKSQWWWWNNGLYGEAFKCPYGKPGEQLWVRETWDVCVMQDEYLPSMCYRADSTGIPTSRKKAWDLLRSDDSRLHKWRPSIHMPRWASRIQLEVTDVRVERVQEISEEDARAEGVALPERTVTMYDGIYREHFQRLWNSINEKRGYGWEANPWVWVVEFKRLQP